MQDLDPELFSHATAKGADFLEGGVTDLPKWTRVMVYQFGDQIRPHLDSVWTSAHQECQKRREAGAILGESRQPQAPALGQGIPRPRGRSRTSLIGVSLALVVVLGLAVVWIRRAQEPMQGTSAGTPTPATKETASGRSLPDFDASEPVKPDDRNGLRVLAEQGDVDAQRALGWCYYSGQGVPQDHEEAAKWFRKAAEQGDAAAQNSLGVLYQLGQGVPQDYAEAVRWYRRAADQGRAPAQGNLALCYGLGLGVEKNMRESARLLLPAAKAGIAYAQFILGVLYRAGDGVPLDYTEAARWFQEAALQGNDDAQTEIGKLYAMGRGVPRDLTKAMEFFRQAADLGNADAQTSLGLGYLGGQGVPQDHEEAAKWFRKAADQGHAGAQYGLGACYLRGQGVRQDSSEAASLFRKAAEQGNADAQHDLGICYDKGEGVQQDRTEEVKWLLRAAAQGNAMAQDALGVCYVMGEGVPKNDVEAYKWFSLAAAREAEGAATLRDSISQRMAREEVVEGQRRAAAFVARAESEPNSTGLGASVQPQLIDTGPKASGTAFFVSEDGYLLSSFHIVEGASKITIKTRNGILRASVVKTDPVNDIVLLKVAGSFEALPFAINRDGKLGQAVFTIGFPNVLLQGIQPKFSRGEISSLSGAQDDPREFQISVPVQPGNSGGPLVDAYGNVIGIVTARLSDAAAVETTGVMPQNVNYATKISYAMPLLESVPGLANRLKAPHASNERKFDDSVQETREAATLVLVY